VKSAASRPHKQLAGSRLQKQLTAAEKRRQLVAAFNFGCSAAARIFSRFVNR
jgi:uncharacterized protein YfcZ (UPF0381/DUF406 family)